MSYGWLSAAGTASLLLSGAIFGFFYAWVCSTMWGLDNAPPQVAIAAMNAMNKAVMNAVFAPAFWGTPIVLTGTAFLAWRAGFSGSAAWLLAGAALYVVGAMGPTAMVNVPMNEALLAGGVPDTAEQARDVWSAFSARWQRWNVVRAVASGGSLWMCGHALTWA